MSVRSRFKIFEEKTHLNSCSYGALSTDVRAAFEQYLADRDAHGSPWDIFMEKYESARAIFAELINAQPEEIAVTGSASAGTNSLASALDFSGPRKKIIVSDFEFPTVAQIWHAQAMRGASIRHVPDDDGYIPIERFDELIDEETLLVSIAHVCFRNGARQNVSAIVELAHSRGALVMLDCYQSLGTLPIDVKALDVDFLVGGTLKYLLSTAGIGYLYVREQLISELTPTMTGWFAQADIDAMDIYGNDPAPTARRFEMGTPPVPSIYATLAGIGLVQSVGLEDIESRIGELTGAIKQRAKREGLTLATPADPARHGAMIALRAQDEHAIVRALAEDRVITSSRDGNLRISPHFYNNFDDIDRLFAGLKKNRHLLA